MTCNKLNHIQIIWKNGFKTFYYQHSLLMIVFRKKLQNVVSFSCYYGWTSKFLVMRTFPKNFVVFCSIFLKFLTCIAVKKWSLTFCIGYELQTVWNEIQMVDKNFAFKNDLFTGNDYYNLPKYCNLSILNKQKKSRSIF